MPSSPLPGSLGREVEKVMHFSTSHGVCRAIAIAGVLAATQAQAGPPSDKPIPPLTGGQFSVIFAPPDCKFDEMKAGFVCKAKHGSFRYAGGGWEVFMENSQDKDKKKNLRLSIALSDEIFIDGKRTKVIFYPLDKWEDFVPVAVPGFEAPVTGPNTFKLDNTAFLPPDKDAPGGTWQMLWSVYPQPASETVSLRDWNMFVAWDMDGDGKIGEAEGKALMFDSSWLKSLSLASHCPEPGTWAMMIAGFGLVGAAKRRAERGAGLKAR